MTKAFADNAVAHTLCTYFTSHDHKVTVW